MSTSTRGAMLAPLLCGTDESQGPPRVLRDDGRRARPARGPGGCTSSKAAAAICGRSPRRLWSERLDFGWARATDVAKPRREELRVCRAALPSEGLLHACSGVALAPILVAAAPAGWFSNQSLGRHLGVLGQLTLGVTDRLPAARDPAGRGRCASARRR